MFEYVGIVFKVFIAIFVVGILFSLVGNVIVFIAAVIEAAFESKAEKRPKPPKPPKPLVSILDGWFAVVLYLAVMTGIIVFTQTDSATAVVYVVSILAAYFSMRVLKRKNDVARWKEIQSNP